MAILKQRLHVKNTSGGYDTVHPETSAEAVLLSDGSTAASQFASLWSGKAPAVHTHSSSQVGHGDSTVESHISNLYNTKSNTDHRHNATQISMLSGDTIENHINGLWSQKAAVSHTHDASQIVSGTFPSATNPLKITAGAYSMGQAGNTSYTTAELDIGYWPKIWIIGFRGPSTGASYGRWVGYTRMLTTTRPSIYWIGHGPDDQSGNKYDANYVNYTSTVTAIQLRSNNGGELYWSYIAVGQL